MIEILQAINQLEILCNFVCLRDWERPKGTARKAFRVKCWVAEQGTECFLLLALLANTLLSLSAQLPCKTRSATFLFFSFLPPRKNIYIRRILYRCDFETVCIDDQPMGQRYFISCSNHNSTCVASSIMRLTVGNN